MLLSIVSSRDVSTQGEIMSTHSQMTRNIRNFICRHGRVRLSVLCQYIQSGYSDQELALQFHVDPKLLQDIRQTMNLPTINASQNQVSNH